MSAPFVEKHRPQTIDDIVGNADIRERLKAFAITGDVPQSCVLWGDPGLGKTTAALAEAKEYYIRRNIYEPDTTLEEIRNNSPRMVQGLFPPSLFVASRIQGTIDFVKVQLARFLQTTPPAMGIIKFVIFDEADGLSKDAQEALLPLIERYPSARLLFTTNQEPVFGLGPAIVSRAGGCVFEFEQPTKEELKAHLKKIAEKEGAALKEESFDSIAETAKDVREAVGMLGSDIALVRSKEAPKLEPTFAKAPTDQEITELAVKILRERDFGTAKDIQDDLKEQGITIDREELLGLLRIEKNRADARIEEAAGKPTYWTLRKREEEEPTGIPPSRWKVGDVAAYQGDLFLLITEELGYDERANQYRYAGVDPQLRVYPALIDQEITLFVLGDVVSLKGQEGEWSVRRLQETRAGGERIWAVMKGDETLAVSEDDMTMVRAVQRPKADDWPEKFRAKIVPAKEEMPAARIALTPEDRVIYDRLFAYPTGLEVPYDSKELFDLPAAETKHIAKVAGVSTQGLIEDVVQRILDFQKTTRERAGKEGEKPKDVDVDVMPEVFLRSGGGVEIVYNMEGKKEPPFTKNLGSGREARAAAFDLIRSGTDTVDIYQEGLQQGFDEEEIIEDVKALGLPFTKGFYILHWKQEEVQVAPDVLKKLEESKIEAGRVAGISAEVAERGKRERQFREKEKAAPPPPKLFKPPERRIDTDDEKALEEDFKAELGLRSIPLKTKDFDYLAAFRSYLRRAENNKVPFKRFRANWLPNIISSVEEAYTNRTRVPGEEVERRIRRADAKFQVGDLVEFEGQLRKVLEADLDVATGRYYYGLEGVENNQDEDLLKVVDIPKAKWSIGDNVMREGRGYIVEDKTFSTEEKKWRYKLRSIRARTGAA